MHARQPVKRAQSFSGERAPSLRLSLIKLTTCFPPRLVVLTVRDWLREIIKPGFAILRVSFAAEQVVPSFPVFLICDHSAENTCSFCACVCARDPRGPRYFRAEDYCDLQLEVGFVNFFFNSLAPRNIEWV